MPPHALARPAAEAALHLAPSSAFVGHWREPLARRMDAAVHVAGATVAAGAAPTLLAAPGGASWPVAAYALAAVALFPASGLFQHGPAAWRDVTIKLDHAAIYLKIAATYGALAAVSGAALGPAAAGPWVLALGGAGLRAMGPPRMRAASLAIYLVVVLGGLAAIWPALSALSPEAYRLVMLGGAVYLVGMLFHLRDRMRFGQAIWHGLVLVASALVCAAILTELGRGAGA